MQRIVRLNRIATVLSELDYPTTPAAVATGCSGIRVELAEGSVDLGETIRQSHATSFTSVEDVELEFMGLLPRHAVGEPFQSEGDA
jgi:hypothetical protein